jgi:nucleoid DNA-binding protein
MAQLNLSTQKKRIAYLDREKYITSVVRYSTLTTEDMIEIASENSGIPKAQMSSALYALFQQVKQFVLNGHCIQLGNLGVLYVSSNAKAKDNEKEAGAASVYRLSLRFRQSKAIRDLINQTVSLNSLDNGDEDEEQENPENGNSTTYTLTVEASPAEGGTVEGSGTYSPGQTVEISAVAKSGYRFSAWNDGDTDANRSVTVTGDATYTATFVSTATGDDGDDDGGVAG